MSDIKTKKPLSDFVGQNWEDASAGLSRLVEFGKQIGDMDIAGGSVWAYANKLNEMIKLDEIKEAGFTLLPFEKSIAGLLDAGLVAGVTDVFRRLSSVIFNVVATEQAPMKISGIGGGEMVVLGDEDCVLLGLSENIIEVWRRNYKLLPPGKRVAFDKDWEEAKILVGDLQIQLAHVAAVLGFGPGIIKTYTFDEFAAIIVSVEDYDSLRMARTIAELMNSENKKDATWLLGEVFSWQDFDKRVEYTWTEAFFFTLTMHLAYSTFSICDEGFRKGIMRNYFYRAILVGVLVKEKVSDFLFETFSVMDYVDKCRKLFENLQNNAEQVIVSNSPNQTMPLDAMIDKYLTQAGDNWDKQESVDGFVASLRIEGRVLKEVAQTALTLAVRLRNCDLVDHNAGGELTAAEEHYNDMVKLIAWFGVGPGGEEPLEKYFRQESPRVPLAAFAKQLREVADLKQETAVDNVVRFTNLLQRNGWLGDSVDLVAYDEKTGEFHWDQEALK